MKRIAQRIMKRVTVEAAAGLALTGMLFMTARYAGLAASGSSVHIGKERPVVVLDSGHGGTFHRPKNDSGLGKDLSISGGVLQGFYDRLVFRKAGLLLCKNECKLG